ncbi:antibiotic biosynthesis monooxygenase [Maridesulfovibrio sp. FT414]|uniref:antibiotic biosynthesis monooxygenase n=1 Tax=Maridesulfovibrio sp. FT414 TaxID=2979469 RepID=UPI003D8006A7
MWIREWKCLCPEDKLNAFLEYLNKTGVDDTQSLDGCSGYSVMTRETEVMTRDTDTMIEITLHTYWRSKEQIKNYAGENMHKAVLYPEDELYEIIPDETVKIYRVTSSSCLL